MKQHTILLPTLENFTIDYNDKVYNPTYTQHDAIVIADAFIRKSRPDLRVLDLACGSGLIGLSLKYMHPEIELTMSDISGDALKVAKRNAKKLGLHAKIVKSDMFKNIDQTFDIIVTNLPSYSEKQMKDAHSPKGTVKDPKLSLYKQLFDSEKAPIIVHEIQAARQREARIIATGRGWVEIMKTDYGFGWLRKPNIQKF